MTKPAIPQGTRDFGPEIVRKRQFITSTIRDVFELYGFLPLETPAMENMETLIGKYGDEGDKLIFKILNNGLNNPAKEKETRLGLEALLQGKTSKIISERALRYDLTIPFARYVAMNHAQLNFPFKRYQIQPVWRADRPQKGRYREFYQCDADVVGSNSLLNEVEFINIYNDVFVRLGILQYQIKINSRKILTALAEKCGGKEKMMDITIAIDKLDKIGIEKVMEELASKALTPQQLQTVEKYIEIEGTNEKKLELLSVLLKNTTAGPEGIEEIRNILTFIQSQGKKLPNLDIDFTLARGLNYYTGVIFEAKAPVNVKIGSIGGGGRYDDLTGLFGLPGIPGVGISFGVDRIFDVMDELSLFPSAIEQSIKVLFFNLGDQESRYAYKLLQQIRLQGVSAEIYHEQAKFDKQFKYAEKKNIPYVVILGSEELQQNSCKIKDLRSGQQQAISFNDFIQFPFA